PQRPVRVVDIELATVDTSDPVRAVNAQRRAIGSPAKALRRREPARVAEWARATIQWHRPDVLSLGVGIRVVDAAPRLIDREAVRDGKPTDHRLEGEAI